MKRSLLLVACFGVMALVAVFARQRPDPALPQSWASKAVAETPAIAVLLEFGVKDVNVRDWSGRAIIDGAKVIKREGYRFRSEDRLIEPDAWQASSRRAIRAPKGQPQISKLEPIASVGIVLYLQDVKDEAAVTLALNAADTEKTRIALRDVLAGQTVPLWGGTAVARLVSTAAPVATSKNEEDFPAAAYGPDGTLWVAYISYHVKEDERRIEPPMLKQQPDDFKKYYTPEFGDQLMVKFYRHGKWSQEIPVTGPNEDLVRCAIGVTGDGEVWTVYSAQRQGNYDLYARRISPKEMRAEVGPEQRLTTNPGPDLTPVMCTDDSGKLWVAYQSWEEQRACIRLVVYGQGWHLTPERLGVRPGNCWHPAIAAGPGGKLAIAFDYYSDQGDYNVEVTLLGEKKDGKDITIHRPIATSSKFEARPSVVYDAAGRLWIAYELGPEKWGKDYGALDAKDGNPLYNERSVRVVCLENGELKRPTAELPTAKYGPPQLPFEPVKTNQFEKAPRYAYPRLGVDLKGRVWLSYRRNFGSRYSSHPGAYWLTFARRLEANGWSEPIEVPHSDGLLDHRPVLLPHVNGGLLVLHNTDGRYTTPEIIDNQIYASVIQLPETAGTPTLVALPQDAPFTNKAAAEEREAVKRIRDYRIDAGGKKYQILRGEFHRHTELSWDGSPDGSLEDMFRYAIDAAAMDWIGNGDHDNGAGREYSWWLTQKFTDAYHVAKVFTPMFTYERSVSYPHGHRNCMFAQRGVRTLPRLAPREGIKEEGGVHPDDTKMLYRYLREFGGICAIHTSATGMGTDWRDNDPVAEPIVEIYQGDRMSYEHENAPRAGYDPKTGKEPANVAGWFPKGFINNAFAKGYKLGFQASSDHWSTHISYMMVLAEKQDRQSILDAVKKRHVYGATDNIIVDFRCGDAIMGDEIKTRKPPTFQIQVFGTSALQKVDILRDSEVVETLTPAPDQPEALAAPPREWTDAKAPAGMHYYYIRVLQRDGEIAWGSPIWVNYQK